MMLHNIQETEQETLQPGEVGSGEEEKGQEKESEMERLQLKQLKGPFNYGKYLFQSWVMEDNKREAEQEQKPWG